MKSKLKGHQKRVTGLAFSSVLNVLVSSGADAQVNTMLYFENLQDPDSLLAGWAFGNSVRFWVFFPVFSVFDSCSMCTEHRTVIIRFGSVLSFRFFNGPAWWIF